MALTTTTENLWGLWREDAAGKLYLSTNGLFKVPGLQGNAQDIFVCTPGSLGDATTCTYSAYWDGSAHGFDTQVIDDFHIMRP